MGRGGASLSMARAVPVKVIRAVSMLRRLRSRSHEADPTIAAWPYDRPVLLGREIERARVCALLAAVHAGNGGALVVRGEPGVGKTALLADVAASVAGMAVVRARGVEGEAELPHASLHELLRPLL